MVRGKQLSEHEIGQIDDYPALGKSNYEIVVLIPRSANVINNYLNDPTTYRQRQSSGRPEKKTIRER